MESHEKKIFPDFIEPSLVKDTREVDKSYRRRAKSKKSGGARIIHAPNKRLKAIQRRLLDFLYLWKLPFNFFGFVREKNIVDNALCHFTGAGGIPKWLLNIDLKDAFPSVTVKVLRKTLRRIFDQLGFPRRKKISELGGITVSEFREIFLRCVTHRGRLPQWASTSPYLLNLVLHAEGVLSKIEEICWRSGVRMVSISIYADDISVTLFNRPSRALMRRISEAIEKSSCFRVNRKKVRSNNRRYVPHLITGIRVVVGDDGIIRATISQKKRNKLRGMIHRAAMLLREGKEPEKDVDGFTTGTIRGYIAWLNMVYHGKMPSDIKKVVESFKLAVKKDC